MRIIKFAAHVAKLLIRSAIAIVLIGIAISTLSESSRSLPDISRDDFSDADPHPAPLPPDADYRQSIDSGLASIRFSFNLWQQSVNAVNLNESLKQSDNIRSWATSLKKINPTQRYVFYDSHIDSACSYLIEFTLLYRQGVEQSSQEKFKQSTYALNMFALKMHDADREKERVGWN